jgi:hypothetical protein
VRAGRRFLGGAQVSWEDGMAKTTRKSSEKSKKTGKESKETISAGKKEVDASGVPLIYLKFLDACLTNSDFRNALYHVYHADSKSSEWADMVKQLNDAGIADASSQKSKDIMKIIVAVDWPDVYEAEKILDRKPDKLRLGDRADILDA